MAKIRSRRGFPERRGINPTLLFFLVGVILLFAGIGLPGFGFLTLIGGFIVATYLITTIVWVFFEAA